MSVITKISLVQTYEASDVSKTSGYGRQELASCRAPYEHCLVGLLQVWCASSGMAVGWIQEARAGKRQCAKSRTSPRDAED
jgi:hypothetical protein